MWVPLRGAATDDGSIPVTVQSTPAAEAPLTADRGASLVVDHLTKRFGGVTAVDDLSFEVANSEALAVIGPNGAGKSSLLKILAGVYTPDAGRVMLNGARLGTRSATRVARMGISLAHQVPRPFKGLTVRENVSIGALSSRRRTRAAAPTAVEEILHTCGLAPKAALEAGQLRLLDLKRLELARALSTDPSLILLDEVAAGLNGRELDDVIELIRTIHSAGRTLVLVEHVEGVVASLVDRVLVIDWGKRVAEGTPAQISANPRVREVYLGAGRQHTATPAEPAMSATPTTPLLTVEGATAAYGDIVALRDVTLTLAAGETVAVLGANGAGKSTLASVISGQLRLRSGVVRFDDTDVTSMPSYQRARSGIAHCPEGRRIFADLSIDENLELAVPLRLPRAQLDARKAVVRDIFPILRDMAHRLAGTLSGGQQQMVAIGRSLMAEPRVLVLDEISLGLAPVAIDALYDALAVIRQRGIAILLVEQNVHRSLAVADQVYVLERGRITYAGEPGPLNDEATLHEFYFGRSAALPTHADPTYTARTSLLPTHTGPTHTEPIPSEDTSSPERTDLS